MATQVRLGLLSLLLFAMALSLAGAGSAQTDPPLSGEWTVADTTVVSQATVNLTGDLLIPQGGSLDLVDVTLVMNSSYPGEFGIWVEPGGSLNITRGSVSAMDPNNTYSFDIQGSARLESTLVERTWGSTTAEVYGIRIMSSSVRIANSTVRYGTRGNILITAGSPTLEGNMISLAVPALTAHNAVALSCYSLSTYEATGVKVMNGASPLLFRNTIRDNPGSTFDEPWRTVFDQDWSNATCPNSFRIYGYFLGIGLHVQNASVEARENLFTLNSYVPPFSPTCRYVNATYVCVTNYGGDGTPALRNPGGAVLRAAGGNFTDNNFTANWYAGLVIGGSSVRPRGGHIANHTASSGFADLSAGLLLTGAAVVERVSLDGNTYAIGISGGGTIELRDLVFTVPSGYPAITAFGTGFSDTTVYNTSMAMFYYAVRLSNGSPARVHLYNCSLSSYPFWGSGSIGFIEAFYWLEYGAVWQNQAPIAGGHARLRNGYNAEIFNGTLDAAGRGPVGWLLSQNVTFAPPSPGSYSNQYLYLDITLASFFSPTMYISFIANTNKTFVVEDAYVPLVSVFTPTEAGAFNGVPLEVSGTTIDVGSGVTRVTVSADGGGTWFDAPGPFESWAVEIPLSEGFYDIYVMVFDRSGNYAATTVRSVEIDNTPPFLSLTDPAVPPSGQPVIYTTLSAIQVRGAAEEGSTIVLNGEVINWTAGSFVTTFTLSEGPNFFLLRVTDRAGNVARVDLEIILDTVPPALIITAPAAVTATTRSPLRVEGRTEPDVALTIGDLPVTAPEGQISAFTDLRPGLNVIWVNATDKAGNRNSVQLRVTWDTEPPRINITAPLDGWVTRDAAIQVSGSVDAQIDQILINGIAVRTAAGAFSSVIPLQEGANTIVVRATDAAGNEANASIHVTLDSQPPTIVLASPTDGLVINTTSVRVAGRATGAYRVVVDGLDVAVTHGLFDEETLIGEGNHTVVVVASDQAGNSAVVRVAVTRDTVAPAITTVLPSDVGTAPGPTFVLSGNAGGAARVWVNGYLVGVDNGGNFTALVALAPGRNTITIRAQDLAGNEATLDIVVTRAAESTPASAGLFGLGAASYALLPAFAVVGALGLLLWQRRRAKAN